ncbi:tRNA pseudouridine(55) synthase TruB [Paenibacillus sp. IB182496]|uniref:tRNA pseudouridine synthase B n=1 Tax=Paenibacillus sabuli TaxID=2772509 RepID=A0A927BSR9_9BACL|nr:tRNA pseudouridine(55) synthase TruB [Paenibacillus sabuli]MBD2845241.1 tRNA pseudouridine(55) synthase TruB [Paenibacillus sabuli]
MDGILAVWKPAGWTSHDVVARARRLLGTKRIGHAGTLDPAVTGVLPLGVGRATRLVEYMQSLPKTYEAELQFGVATDTEDLTGTVLEQLDRVELDERQIRQTLVRFVGDIRQTPPMYSAVRVQGKRLYELARAGQEVERPERTVTIHALELLRLELSGDSPRIAFSATCSKGTYIRTLCVDIGRALGVPAAMAKLVRTVSAGLTQADCVTLEELERRAQEQTAADCLLPPDRAVAHLPRLTVPADEARAAMQGKKLPLRMDDPDTAGEQLLRLYGLGGRFLGIFQSNPQEGIIRPVKVFAQAES